MRKKRNAITRIFIGTEGDISSKRVIMFLSFLVMIALAVSNIFYDKSIEDFIFEGFLWIVIASLGTVASEKFSKRIGNRSKSYTGDYEDDDTSWSKSGDDEPEFKNDVSRWERDEHFEGDPEDTSGK